MLKGLAITPPVIGRISIGRVVERNGKRLPEKDDQFTLTSQVQNREGWVLHPLDEVLRKDAGGKLRSIPVRMLFNDPALNLRADYSLFDRTTGRPMCVGNGESCRRAGKDGIESLPCPSARHRRDAASAWAIASRMPASMCWLGMRTPWAHSCSEPRRTTRSARWRLGCSTSKRSQADCWPACRWN